MLDESQDERTRIKTIVLHAEFSDENKKASHIPEVSFEFGDAGLPTHLIADSGVYEVSARRDEATPEEFFDWEMKRADDDGSVKSIKFNGPYAGLAREFFDILLEKYKNKVVSTLKNNGDIEFQMEHMERPGIVNQLQSEEDKRTREILVKEAVSGIIESQSNLGALLIARDVYMKAKAGYESIMRYVFPPLVKQKEIMPKNTVIFSENDPLGYLTDEVIDWIERIKSSEEMITIQGTEIAYGQENFRIHNVQIGRIKSSETEMYASEEQAARVILFAHEKLGMPIRPTLRIYHNSFFIHDNESDYSIVDDESYRLFGIAFNSGRAILVNDIRRSIVDPFKEGQDEMVVYAHEEIDSNHRSASIRHETAHYVDVDKYYGTLPQGEAFAMAMEYGFVFENVRRVIEERIHYDRELSPDFVKYIFSTNPKGLSPAEIYAVSSSFYCWIYEKFGSEAFSTFHGLLAGGIIASSMRGLSGHERIDKEIEMERRFGVYKGNLADSLGMIIKRYGDEDSPNPEGLLDQFVSEFNQFHTKNSKK